MGSPPYQFVLFGASGVFGRRVLKRLLPLPGVEVRVACRKKEQAIGLSKEFGPMVVPLWGDVHRKKEVRSLAKGADALFHCAGPFRLQPIFPLEVALEERLHYADLGDDVEYLQKAYQAISASSCKDRLIIPGASSLPSITSLLARMAELRWGPIQKIRIHVFMGNRNPKGKGAIDYLIRALRKPFQAMRGGKWTPQRTWSEHIRYESRFLSGKHLFSLIESPDDTYLPIWFSPGDTAFYVSLEFSWIHLVISAIQQMQRLLPRSVDPLWMRFLYPLAWDPPRLARNRDDPPRRRPHHALYPAAGRPR
jgi:saccharopine dehydrogenase-like NADP-dependent oxidoreductase